MVLFVVSTTEIAPSDVGSALLQLAELVQVEEAGENFNVGQVFSFP